MVPSSITAKPIPGGWTQREIAVGDRVFDLVLPADPDEFLNQLEADSGNSLVEPYWAALWPAAPIMAKRLLTQDWPPGTAALELGCGTGLVGLAALAAGLEVTFSDVVPTAIELALENARRNSFSGAQAQLLDWFDPPRSQYPLILGCDLLYETRQHPVLLNAIDRLLGDDGQCWLGDPGRSAAAKFVDLAQDRCYRVRLYGEDGQPARLRLGHFRLLVLRRGSGCAEDESTGAAASGDIES